MDRGRNQIPCQYFSRGHDCTGDCPYLHSEESRLMFQAIGDALWDDGGDAAKDGGGARRGFRPRRAPVVMPAAAAQGNGLERRAFPQFTSAGWAGRRGYPSQANDGVAFFQPATIPDQDGPAYAPIAPVLGYHHQLAGVVDSLASLSSLRQHNDYGRPSQLQPARSHYEEQRYQPYGNVLYAHGGDPFRMRQPPRGYRTRQHHVDPDAMTYDELSALCDSVGSVEVPTNMWRRWILTTEELFAASRSTAAPASASAASPTQDDAMQCSICLESCAAHPPPSAEDDDDVEFLGRRSATTLVFIPSAAMRRMSIGPAHPPPEVIRLPCRHFLHVECATQYLDSKHLCPVCRLDLNTITMDSPPEAAAGGSSAPQGGKKKWRGRNSRRYDH